MNTKPMIKAQNIRRSFTLGIHSLHILQGLTFQVERGEWVTLTGPSCSGKSTLPGILAGIDQPSCGRLWLDEYEISGMRQENEVNPFTELTNREMEVLRIIPEGKNNREINEAPVISVKIVKSHVTNILSKLHLVDRTQVAVYAWRKGIKRRD